MSIKLIDFKDIQDSILEELKIQDSDTVSIQRIKRAINEVYINEVVPHARWKWLENHVKVRFNAAYSSGTAEVTPSSVTVTLTPAPSVSLGSFANQYFSVAGHTEVYIIDSHTAGSATLTLTSQFLGVFNETASFKVWSDKVALPTDCRETVTVWHNMYSRPMDAMGWQKFRELTINNPKLEGYPRVYYTGDFVGDLEASRYRELRVHPAIHNVPVTVSVDYVRDVVELINDGDEPVVPVEDRIVLKYGALAWAWRALMRNPEEANTNYQLFKQKLERMAGKIEDSHDTPQLNVNSLYMKRRRAPKYKIGTQVFENGSGGSTNSQSSQFLQNPIIQGARFTADVTVDTGVTVDGVDISELAQDFADHLTDAIDAHDASSISFVPSGSIAASDVQTAIAEVATDAAADLAAHINDSSDAHDASAISFSPVGSIAATDAQTAIAEVATDAASALSTHEADTTSIHGITDTSDLLTTSNSKTVTNKTISTANNTIQSGSATNGQVLTANGSGGTSWVSPGAARTLIPPNIQKFTSGSGTYTKAYAFVISSGSATAAATYTNNGNTYTVLNTVSSSTLVYMSGTADPTTNGTLTKASGTGDSSLTFTEFAKPICLNVKMVGGGGGGGGSAQNGGGGSAGGTGGNTTFGTSLLDANGGAGGQQTGGVGGTGGTASLGTGPIGFAIQGGYGASSGGGTGITNHQNPGGHGGVSFFGGAGYGSPTQGAAATAAITNSGSGGGGGGYSTGTSTLGFAGAGGGAGGFVDAIIYSPSTTYSYVVGAAGALGSSGTSGRDGAAGGSGVIIVEERFQ